MPKIRLTNGKTVTYPNPPAGFGWVQGSTRGGSYHLFIRASEHGGGVLVDLGDGRGLVKADTGEPTVYFNNRYWTLSEEKEYVARIQSDDTN